MTNALRDDSVARTVSIGQHLSTSYPGVISHVASVVDTIQECGGHSADYAETFGRIFSADPAQFIGSGTSDVRMLSTAHETCCQSTVVVV